jgi:hypothetical protein
MTLFLCESGLRVASCYAPPPVAPALGRAFGAACHHHGPAFDERLLDATRALVERLKRDGLPPEKVLIAVKTALTHYGNLHHPPSLDADADEDPMAAECAAHYRLVFDRFLKTYYESR